MDVAVDVVVGVAVDEDDGLCDVCDVCDDEPTGVFDGETADQSEDAVVESPGVPVGESVGEADAVSAGVSVGEAVVVAMGGSGSVVAAASVGDDGTAASP